MRITKIYLILSILLVRESLGFTLPTLFKIYESNPVSLVLRFAKSIYSDNYEQTIQSNRKVYRPYSKLSLPDSVIASNIGISGGFDDTSTLMHGNLSLPCLSAYASMIESLNSTQSWGLMILDATGKLEPGILIGNLWSMGSYRECTNITGSAHLLNGTFPTLWPPFPIDNESTTTHHPMQRKSQEEFDLTGKYCRVNLQKTGAKKASLYDQVSFNWGVCFPSVCTSGDVSILVNEVTEWLDEQLGRIDTNSTTQVQSKINCIVNRSELGFTPAGIAAIIICSILFLVLLVGTLYDLAWRISQRYFLHLFSSQKGYTRFSPNGQSAEEFSSGNHTINAEGTFGPTLGNNITPLVSESRGITPGVFSPEELQNENLRFTSNADQSQGRYGAMMPASSIFPNNSQIQVAANGPRDYMPTPGPGERPSVPGHMGDQQTTRTLEGSESSVSGKKRPWKHGKLGHALLCFSVITNFLKVVKVPGPTAKNIRGGQGEDDQLDCLHGLRFFSMIWVIWGHTFIYGLNFMAYSPSIYADDISNFSFQVLANGSVSVDIFFVMSGMLVAYITLKKLFSNVPEGSKPKPQRFPWWYFYVHRFYRLTPVYGFVILVFVTLYRYVDTGPFWPQGDVFDENCRTGWWTNLLYINNLHSGTNISILGCLGWTWYLANDTQFYIASPLIIILLAMWPIWGFVVIGLVIAVSIVSSGIINYVNDYSINFMIATFQHAPPNNFGYFNQEADIYIKPYTRCGAYAIGMLAGYILFKYKKTMRFRWYYVLLGWLVAIGCTWFAVFAPFDPDRGTVQLNRFSTALFIAFQRPVFSAGVAWLVLACVNGYGGFINDFLSWKVWIPLSRITFCAYLVHPFLVNYIYYKLEFPLVLTGVWVYYLLLGHFTLIFAVALALSVALEAPLLQLEKLLLRPGRH